MQTKILASILLALMIPALANAVQVSDGWVKYAPDDARFSVLFPQTPATRVDSSTTKSGEKLTKYLTQAVDASGSGYVVGFTDYSFALDPQKSLDAARDASIEAVKGALLREFTITIDGNSGREYLASAKIGETDYMVQARWYVVGGNRVYGLMYIHAKSLDQETAAKNAAKFFDSFKLAAGK